MLTWVLVALLRCFEREEGEKNNVGKRCEKGRKRERVTKIILNNLTTKEEKRE